MADGISMNAGDIAKIALGSGGIAALISQGITFFVGWKKESRSDGRMRRYSAIRIAVALETFAVQCNEVVWETEASINSDGHIGKEHGSIPAMGKYPNDIEWRLLDVELCAKILAFENEIELCRKNLSFAIDVQPFREDIVQVVILETGKCGYRAWELAKTLRAMYKLPNFDPEEFTGATLVDLKRVHDAALTGIKA